MAYKTHGSIVLSLLKVSFPGNVMTSDCIYRVGHAPVYQILNIHNRFKLIEMVNTKSKRRMLQCIFDDVLDQSDCMSVLLTGCGKSLAYHVAILVSE